MQAINFQIIKQKIIFKAGVLVKKIWLKTITGILIITIVIGGLCPIVSATEIQKYNEKPGIVAVDSYEQQSRIVAQFGDKNDTVKEIQQILLDLGFTSQQVTGFYGSITKNNVLFFQKDVQEREKNKILGLKCTGIVDDKTYSALQIEYERITPQLTAVQELELEMGLISCLEELNECLKQQEQMRQQQQNFLTNKLFSKDLRNFIQKNSEDKIKELQELIVTNPKFNQRSRLVSFEKYIWQKNIWRIEKAINEVLHQYPSIEQEQKRRNSIVVKGTVSFFVDLTGIPGFLKSLNEAFEGIDLVTSRQISRLEQSWNLVLSALPFVGGIAKDGKTVLKAEKLGEVISRSRDIQKIKTIALIGKGDKLERLWKTLKPVRGYTDVIIHGNATQGFAVLRDNKWILITHRDLASFIKKTYNGGPVRLVSCNIGKEFDKGFAQDLANKLGVEVVAPSDKVWLKPDGYTVIGQTPDKSTGCWRIYFPFGKKPPAPKN